jgi:hypothetical protein
VLLGDPGGGWLPRVTAAAGLLCRLRHQLSRHHRRTTGSLLCTGVPLLLLLLLQFAGLGPCGKYSVAPYMCKGACS